MFIFGVNVVLYFVKIPSGSRNFYAVFTGINMRTWTTRLLNLAIKLKLVTTILVLRLCELCGILDQDVHLGGRNIVCQSCWYFKIIPVSKTRSS